MKYIISAFKFHETTLINYSNHIALYHMLKKYDFSFKEVYGKYNNKLELSYLVESDRVSKLIYLAKLFKQDCILQLDNNNKAKLIYTSSELKDEELGYFNKVSKEYAESQKAFSYIPNEGYYVARMDS